MNTSTSFDLELDQLLEWRLDEEEKQSKKFDETSYINTQDLKKWLLRLMSGNITKIKSKDVKRYRSQLDPNKAQWAKIRKKYLIFKERYFQKTRQIIFLPIFFEFWRFLIG